MEGQARGRSPSVGRQNNQHIRNSPSPHDFRAHGSHSEFNPGNQTLTQPFSANDISPGTITDINYNLYNSNLDTGGQQSFQQPFDSFEQPFPSNGLDVTAQVSLDAQQNHPFRTDMLTVDPQFSGFPHQQGFNKPDLMLDPQLQAGGHLANQAINPQDIMSNMSSPNNLAPTSPHFARQHSEPSSPFAQSPQNQTHQSPHHSRQASLDPSSAFSNGQQEWSGMMAGPQFTGHRRAPSEYSDVSSSNAPSPFLNQNDGFEHIEHSHSPLMNPQQDPQYHPDALRFDTVQISDQQRASPRHSPFVSPRMSPQAGLGPVEDISFMGLPQGSLQTDQYSAPHLERFPSVQPEQRLGSNDFGRADQYDVPQINVDPAPTTQTHPIENARSPTDIDALSPPERGRRRGRALSDTHVPRSSTPSSTAVNLGSPESSISSRQGSLSPFDAGVSANSSRAGSPAGRSPSARRSSTSSIPNRDYILELADPTRPPAPGTERRVQKHPATFSCHLCPKKFTRAYNLRSHLRTHTDERPFVCTVCSKAFARQHDRKRHEGLHSGEKKFVCRGELGTGAQWGCGRRFARADALGRHFRSEAGRVCIKPLLDEEAIERQRANEQFMAQRTGGLQPGINGMPIQQQFAFPAALLQQFPQLQGLSWDALGNSGPEEDDLSGRSSFDASSGGDFEYEDDGSGYMSDNPMGSGFQQQGMSWQDQGWKSDVEP